MINLSVDFSESCGKIKPMHAVNNGPVYKPYSAFDSNNFEDYKNAGIPYARNHDASFCSDYGGSHTVDINAIFPDFNADAYDENSYDFACTDEYIRVTELAGAKTFYRLGSRIEHEIKKYGTLPPADFQKWAVICEHIIRHYNYGWANGFNYGLEYWEIWNEPDLDGDNAADKRTWGGTAAEFYELYNITANHLKKCFPELKIGGPAVAGIKRDWLEGFFDSLDTAPDFFSWHWYGRDPHEALKRARIVREILDERGYTETESIFNEWNYSCGWSSEKIKKSVGTITSLKGSSFISAVMCGSQHEAVDMVMYYDARPCSLNGMWDLYFLNKLKGYYPFVMFNNLYRLGESVKVSSDDENVFLCAAKNGHEGSVFITHYNDDDTLPTAHIQLDIGGFEAENGVTAEFYVLDEDHDLELVRTEKLSSNEFALNFDMPLYTSVLIKLKERE